VEDKERRMISFQVSADELEAIEGEAAKQGISRSEYLRTKVLARASEGQHDDLEVLLRHLIYIATRTHNAVYSISEEQGSLATERLQRIYDRALTDGVKYMNELPQRIAKANAQIAGNTNGAPPAAE
jgi:predicted outer membrane protein